MVLAVECGLGVSGWLLVLDLVGVRSWSLARLSKWCQNGAMKRVNLRDVPDEVYSTLVEAAGANRQSLNSYVVDRLAEMAQVARLAGYVRSYAPPTGTGVTLDDAAAAVREVREGS
ncbi:MAG: hypothetical protein QG622_1178 [Actinomycetota bacterium]|nr:hypothetical protein [Actinomycetota bacterium]